MNKNGQHRDSEMKSQDSSHLLLSLPAAIMPTGAYPFFTIRGGGGSTGGYESLNLGMHVGDDPVAVQKNRERLLECLRPGAQVLCLINQVHGNKSVLADPSGPVLDADALVTDKKGVAIGVMTADCAPVLFYDPVGRVTGAAHAGWRGALNGIVESCIDLMETLGGDARRMTAIIGPTIRPPNYEVDEPFFNTFQEYARQEPGMNVEKFFLSLANCGRFQFNLPQFIREKLRKRGVPQEGIHDAGTCTFKNEKLFFSHRRSSVCGEGACGRQMGGIVLV